MEKNLRAGSLRALNPAAGEIKTLGSPRSVLITGCSGGLFCLAGCLLNGGVSHGCVPVLCVCGACRKSSSAFLSAVLGLFKNKGTPAASCKVQKRRVKLEGEDLFWDKAAGLN